MTEMIGTSVAMLILWMGAREVLLGGRTMDSATLITFMIMVMRLLPPLKQLSQAPTTAQQSFASAERLFEVVDLATESQSDRVPRAAARSSPSSAPAGQARARSST
jgi:subfamily B ATP-binding cassette protein MsbA